MGAGNNGVFCTSDLGWRHYGDLRMASVAFMLCPCFLVDFSKGPVESGGVRLVVLAALVVTREHLFVAMALYKGTAADGNRASAYEKMRNEKQVEFERLKEKIRQENQIGNIKQMDDRFQSKDTRVEDTFKRSTVGLVSAEEFKKKRQQAEEALRLQDELKRKEKEVAKRKRDEERRKKMNSLSFDVDELEEEDDGASKRKAANSEEKADKSEPGSSDSEKKDEETAEEEAERAAKRAKQFGKNPEVSTHFLPDKRREQEEQELRDKLAREWKEQQEKIKKEQIEITYSYWDGSGHRRTIKVEKGARIDQFLEQCRRDLQDAFHELRATSSENLMYIKEDLIIPHHYTFYDLIISKARGKSGPLFVFDVHDDVRLLQDVRIEKDESHAGKIVTRAWYDRNKHIFPASRWEVYDPSVKREKYTIKGHEVR